MRLPLAETTLLFGLVSPSMFRVMPVTAFWREARGLFRQARNDASAARVRDGLQTALLEGGGCVELTDRVRPRPLSELKAEARLLRGQRVLEAYFASVGRADATYVDFRPDRFESAGARLLWSPLPVHVEWDRAFLAGVRDMYTGFYRDEPERMRAGLAALELSGAEQAMRAHFGEGDQRSVMFTSAGFKASFGRVFDRVAELGHPLHPNFIGLGAMLATLYLHLEAVGVPLDVRTAFEASWT